MTIDAPRRTPPHPLERQAVASRDVEIPPRSLTGRSTSPGLPRPATARLRALGLVAVIASGQLPAQETQATAREIAGYIDELTASTPATPERVTKIASILTATDPARTYGPLLEAAAIEGKRPRVAWLVAEVKHPRAWDLLGKYLATADYDVVVDALVACGGEVVERELRNRWAGEATDSKLYSYLVAKFTTAQLGAESVTFFASRVADDKKGQDARSITRAALGLAPEASDSEMVSDREIRDALAVFRGKAKLYSQAWRTTGVPVALRGGQGWGENRLYEIGPAVYAALPDWTQRKKHTLVVRFLPLSADDCEVGYASAQGIWSVRMRGGKGTVVQVDKVEYPTGARIGSWCEIRFDVNPTDIPDTVEKSREITITVAGKPLPGEHTFNGDLEGIYIIGSVVIGGCEVIRG